MHVGANRRIAIVWGQPPAGVDLMKPILDDMYRLGGSHAQQDVLEQVFLDSAVKANRGGDVRTMLARVAARYPTAPENWGGYAQSAQQFRSWRHWGKKRTPMRSGADS